LRTCRRSRGSSHRQSSAYADDERFVSTYFRRFGPHTYVVGDAARRDSDGYFWIIGRTDDVINVSGHRLSTAEVESAIVAHARVAEAAAVVAEADELTGQVIVAFVTLTGNQQGDDQVAAEIREYVGVRIGELARPKWIIWAEDLPKTPWQDHAPAAPGHRRGTRAW
jgi:acetyl-CoA synthetase